MSGLSNFSLDSLNIIKINFLENDGFEIILSKYTTHKYTKLDIIDFCEFVCKNKYSSNAIDFKSKIYVLDCSKTLIQTIENLPENLQKFNYSNNYIEILPELPQSLKKLNIFSNRLNILKDLPDGLEDLNCSHNQIETLIIPSNLKINRNVVERIIELSEE
jgi:hypothetical protein